MNTTDNDNEKLPIDWLERVMCWPLFRFSIRRPDRNAERSDFGSRSYGDSNSF